MLSSKTFLAIAALVVLAFLAGACGASEEPAAVVSDPAPETIDARCGVQQDDGSFDVVDCSEPHDGQLAGVVAGPGEVPEPVDVDGSESSEVYADFDLVRSCVEPVTALIGEPLVAYGIDVAYVTDSEPGEDYEAEVECWAWSRAEGVLSKPIADGGLAEALGDHAVIGSLSPGDCFRFADPDDDSFDIVTPTECDEDDPAVIEVLGSVELEGAYPGNDAIIEDGDDGCQDLAADSESSVDASDVSFTYPTERSWEALGQTTVICFVERSAPANGASDSYCLSVPEGSSEGTEVDCSEPHNAEFVGIGEPPAGALPDDQVDMDIAIARICRPVAAEAIGVDVLPDFLSTGNPPEARPGATLTEPFNCFIKMSPEDILTGSLFDVDPAEALGDYAPVAELEPGDCFLEVETNFDFAVPVDCSDADALMAIGSFEVDEDGEFPGLDALRAMRNDRCREILEDAGLDVDPATVSGVLPSEVQWAAVDLRTITCEGVPS
jgi:hypothetical protein